MLIVKNVLADTAVHQLRESIQKGQWVDGRATAGFQSAQVKTNQQLDESSPVAREAGDFVLRCLADKPEFMSAALPAKIFPPLINRYGPEEHFGDHIDNAIRLVPQSHVKVRTDLSMTLFLSEPDEYQGGELIVSSMGSEQRFKCRAGDLVLYPASSVHRVTPVQSGIRLAVFTWIQSLVRSNEERAILYSLDQSIQALSVQHPESGQLVELTGVYHNLLRLWSDTN